MLLIHTHTLAHILAHIWLVKGAVCFFSIRQQAQSFRKIYAHFFFSSMRFHWVRNENTYIKYINFGDLYNQIGPIVINHVGFRNPTPSIQQIHLKSQRQQTIHTKFKLTRKFVMKYHSIVFDETICTTIAFSDYQIRQFHKSSWQWRRSD